MQAVLKVPFLWADAFTPFPWLIVVKAGKEGDEVLMAHERVHQMQMRRDGWLRFVLRYATKKGRLAYEVEAYQESYRLNPQGIDFYAAVLANKYATGISTQEAKALIQGA